MIFNFVIKKYLLFILLVQFSVCIYAQDIGYTQKKEIDSLHRKGILINDLNSPSFLNEGSVNRNHKSIYKLSFIDSKFYSEVIE